MFPPIDLNTVAGRSDRDALVGVAFPLENRLKQEGYVALGIVLGTVMSFVTIRSSLISIISSLSNRYQKQMTFNRSNGVSYQI